MSKPAYFKTKTCQTRATGFLASRHRRTSFLCSKGRKTQSPLLEDCQALVSIDVLFTNLVESMILILRSEILYWSRLGKKFIFSAIRVRLCNLRTTEIFYCIFFIWKEFLREKKKHQKNFLKMDLNFEFSFWYFKKAVLISLIECSFNETFHLQKLEIINIFSKIFFLNFLQKNFSL